MLRVSLRAKLALVSLVLLVLPWAGYRYVSEIERFLLESQRQSLMAMAKAVATALHERPRLMRLSTPLRTPPPASHEAAGEGAAAPVETAVPIPVHSDRLPESAPLHPEKELAALLQGAERGDARFWVVNRDLKVLAVVGGLKPAADDEVPSGRRWLAWLIQPPPRDFDDSFDRAALTSRPEVTEALFGAGSARVRKTRDGRATVISAAQPIWAADNVVGAMVAEQTTNSILSVRNVAIERLLILTLTVFAAVALVLLGFATRLSSRIRRLRDEAEGAIDAQGRIGRLTAGSSAGDEIGDLSRSFSTVLTRLGQHHAYLESLASRLSHELRTPVAVVRSSLENLRMQGVGPDAAVYVDRAEEGLGRLSRILSRMAEATRLETSLATQERERYDLSAVVRDCAEGYRLAYPGQAFDLRLPAVPGFVLGSPDLAAQMLDKLVSNAVDFSVEGAAVVLEVAAEEGWQRLSVSNQGPALPESMTGKLFEAMISMRPASGGGEPHLGLGLYVARLIAEFHGGRIEAVNLVDGCGVEMRVTLPSAGV
ncbi:MAG: hypothetical protein EG825_15470 [Rhodocyclaceae bacterium]|nr:hypothetical protein [Rhodocyclaceae bacterium]